VCFALIAIAVAGHVLRLTGMIRSSDLSRLILGDAFFVFLTLLQWYEATRRVTLTEDAVEVTDWFSTRTIPRDKIQARRLQLGKGGWRHVLIPADPGERPLKFPSNIQTDSALSEWLRPIPRLRQRSGASIFRPFR